MGHGSRQWAWSRPAPHQETDLGATGNPEREAPSDRRDLFITGATGLVGTALLQRLNPAQFGQIRLLQRRRLGPQDSRVQADNLSAVYGSLEDPSSYSAAVTDRTVVVHLAAQTGNAPAREHDRLNRQATEDLLEVALARGAVGFLYVSTIAVTFGNRRGYPYAEAKARAEQAVGGSGVPYAIVRPTMVFGPDAPVWLALSGLAKRSLVPVPGNGRIRVQPIWVDDLADTLVRITRQSRFLGETLELGGVDTVTMDELLGRMQQALRGTTRPRLTHIPVRPLIPILHLMEAVLPFQPPATAGQLYSFLNDGAADLALQGDGLHTPTWTLDRMIQALVGTSEAPAADRERGDT